MKQATPLVLVVTLAVIALILSVRKKEEAPSKDTQAPTSATQKTDTSVAKATAKPAARTKAKPAAASSAAKTPESRKDEWGCLVDTTLCVGFYCRGVGISTFCYSSFEIAIYFVDSLSKYFFFRLIERTS